MRTSRNRSAKRPIDPPPRYRVTVSNWQRRVRVDPSALRMMVELTLALEGVHRADVRVVLIDDRRIATLNRQFLGHPGPTDVLSFPSVSSHRYLEGDVAVSVETAFRQARQRQLPLLAELALYAVHGVLHLLGYDDRSTRKRRQMWARQREILQELGLTYRP